MLEGHATAEATQRYATRHAEAEAAAFYRPAQEWRVSSLGIGTYLGAVDNRTDQDYEEAITAALRGGINFLDTAINYRHQRSERCVGRAIRQLVEKGEIRREEIVVCTKAGFLVPGAIPRGVRLEGVAGGMHSLDPGFLADQIERSLSNLGLSTIDVFYLHNPETQLEFVSGPEFDTRLRKAFDLLERLAGEGRIRYYGAATWGALRTSPGSGAALSLSRMAEFAREAGGERNRFRFVQLPFNLAMPEAFSSKTQDKRTALEAARQFGFTVVGSASLLQSRLARNLPEALQSAFPQCGSDAQRAIQFTRSAPGITVALAGMSKAAHLHENLKVASFPPLAPAEFERTFAPHR